MASSTPIILPHGPLLVARILCHIHSPPSCSTPLSWNAARLRSEGRQVMHALWDFHILPRQSHRLHRQPLHPRQSCPPLLQAKEVVGTLIMIRHGWMLAARIPPHCLYMPLCSTTLSWNAARLRSEDRQVMHVLWDFHILPQQSHRLHRQP
jgi:hypothetical protein